MSSTDHNEIWGCIVNIFGNNDNFSIVGRFVMKKASSVASTEPA